MQQVDLEFEAREEGKVSGGCAEHGKGKVKLRV